MTNMMDETEIKQEFNIVFNKQCCVCLSLRRKLTPVKEYISVFRRLSAGIDYEIPLENLLLCWECHAKLRKAYLFQEQAFKALEVFRTNQCSIYGTQSTLTTIILNDCHPNTVYISDITIETEVKNIDNNVNDHDGDHFDHCNDEMPGEVVDNDSLKKEETVQIDEEPKKPKNNRWAIKKALQNKKPKFKILTKYSKDLYRKISINETELLHCMKRNRDSEYYKSKKFKCNKCVIVFRNEELLMRHDTKFHNKKAAYICDICNATTSSKSTLSRHISGHYYKFVCALCDFSCYDKSYIRHHCEKQHVKVFQCVKCVLKFGSRKEFFKHYKEWHEKFICHHCGISFKMRYCIKDHIRKKHSPFVCIPCNKTWTRYNGLWIHNKTTHDVNKVAYCVECDKQYRDVYRYRWHLANSIRHREKKKTRIPCPGCNKVFSKKIYMKDHYNLVHLKYYKYRCEPCDKNFSRNADLVKHRRRIHEGIMPPKNKICYMCGRGFTTNEILKNHIRTHTGEKPFVCSICNARFAQNIALVAHARAIHRNVEK